MIVSSWLGTREWTFPNLTYLREKLDRLKDQLPVGFYGDSLRARDVDAFDVQPFMIGLRELLNG